MKVPNENILKLREITNRLTNEKDYDYQDIIKKLKTIVDEGKNVIDQSHCPESKIKCYETMCITITKLLKNVKV